MNVDVISKATGAVVQVGGDTVDLDAPSIVRLDIDRASIAGIERQGHDLVIRLASGETVRVVDFYPDGAAMPNDLVLREGDGRLWLAHTDGGAARFSLLRELDDLMAAASAEGGGSSLLLPAVLGGVAAVGGAVALAAGGGGDGDQRPSGGGQPDPDPGNGGTAPDRDPPAVPTASVRGDGGAVTGRGEAGATVTVRDATGAVLATAVVAADGSYAVTVTPPLVNGERLTVSQADAAGNVSPTATVQAPDLTAPAAPTASVDATGATVTGRGEAGATVTVRDAAGAVLGTAVVAADGSYAVTLSPARADGTSVTVTQADAAGNASPAVTVATPDLAAPTAPTALIDTAGVQVAGTGEPGARVTVTGPGGATVGSAIVAADGRYTLTLDPAQTNGEPLRVLQTDAAGNASPATTLAAPDLTAPVAPVANVAADGSAVTGTGEPGARVTVSDAGGTAIGTATVGADGQFSVALTPSRANGEALRVVQTDAAGNVSPTVALVAPDVTAPAAPPAALDATGTVVSGTGEPGARVSIRDGGGVEIGSATVGAQGNYVVVLATPQIDSQALTVTQADAAGNVSPATPLVAPDLTAPGAPTASVAADGASIGGTGEAGATVTVRGPLGGVIATVVVAADGTYTVPLVPAQTDGEALSVRQTDPAGNASPVTTATAPDLVVEPRPDAPTAAVSADGGAVTGVAGGGAAITLYDAEGNVIATGTAAADGSYSIALTPPWVDGETVRVTQTDAAGDVSPPASAIAPDLTAPAAPAATLDATGSVVTGTAEAGATIVVRDADGTILGSGTANARGGFVVTLASPQVDGGTLAVTQADAAGNVSPPTALATLDLIAPDAPLATVAADGSAVTGTGEPGTLATVRDPAGAIVGTATVAADGSYTVPLTPAQANGEALSVTLSDTAGNVSPTTAVTAPDITAPPAPAATLDASGSVVTGTGEAGATVTVSGPGGPLATTIVGADGRYVAILPAAQVNGEALTVTQADAAGNASPATPLTAPDTIAPDAPVAAVSGDGTSVTGTGEAGATVTVTDPAGAPLGSATVGADGRFTVPLTPPQANGGTVQVTQTDPAGNASPTVSAAAPDITPPAVPVATVNADGSAIVGSGEPGAQVSVTTATGVALGTATVAADGSFTVALTPAQANGEALVVTQADGAGNVSPSLPLTAPDITPPAAPVATVVAGGVALVGSGEPGARVTVTDAAGAPLGTATVAADGSFTVTLSPAQANGETVRVTQTDAAGNASPVASVVAPDLTAPAQPLATIAADGTTVTGSGEPGARVTVVGATGVPVGTATVAADGSFTVPLTPAQANGESLRVTQADAAGNVSPSLALTAPDITPPAQPAATVDPTGTIVTGTGEPGATVTVRDTGGEPLGSATVNAQGGFAVVLSPAQANAQPLSVVQADAAGNVSPPLPLVAPDLTAPAAPTATVGGDGLSLTGTGEAGANVTVRDPLGVIIGTGVVAADGSYTVTLAPAQVDGEVLSVVQADAAGNVSPAATATAPDVVIDANPAAPTATVGADGAAVVGVALPGAAVTVYDAGGAVIATGTAAPDGTYSVALTPPRIDGETVRVTQTATDGGVSPPATAIAPDLTAPVAPGATLDATGIVVTGTGEPGATVTVRAADGSPLGTAVVTAGGAYAAVLTAAQTNGETLSVTQADRAGNVSPSASLIAADITAPGVPVVTIATDGASVAGTGEPGAIVTVRDAAGTIVGTAGVAADGSFVAPLSPAQANGGTVSVVQADAAGNVSGPATLAAPDITAPAAPTIAVAADGLVASGIGEPGATVTITGAGGVVLGTGPVAVDGRYSIALSSAQIDGQTLTVRQADAAGNVSAPATGIAPDLIAPAAPTLAVTADGTGVTGTGEPGARIVVTGPAGTVLGVATVGADGNFATTLASAQVNGERLTATQTDGGGNLSPPAAAVAPDLTPPAVPTLTIAADGTSASGTGEAGATLTLTGPGGAAVATIVVAADGSYTIPLVPPRVDGALFTATQADAAGNVSPAATAVAPDLIAPAAPVASVGAAGDVVTGTGEAGATVTVATAGGTPLGSAPVAADGSFSVPLSTAQRDGEALVIRQADAAGNVSPPTNAVAPDLTAPAAPTGLTVAGDGATLTGAGEAGARVEVRGGGVLLGTATVAADGSFSVPLAPAQVTGATLSVTQADGAGNVSGMASVVAPFDIDAFDNADTVTVDLLPAATAVSVGRADYVALVSLGLLNLQAQVLAVPNVRFTVQPGHSLDAVFTYDATLNIGVASGYAVVVQQLVGGQWVAVEGSGPASLLDVGLLNGNLSATDTLGPGEYRAFLTFNGTAGVGLLGNLTVTGTDLDYTDVAGVTPGSATGNVITDPGPGGEVDVVSPGTRIASVSVGGVETPVTADGTVVTGAWGRLTINLDGSYSYVPNADAAAIGRTDVFTYTLVDPTDGERESANLSIAIGSGDVTGAPVAIADTGIAAVTFQNVVTTTAPAPAFSFQTGGIGAPNSGSGAFTVATDTVADITINAVRAPGLTLLPSYTLTVRDAAGVAVSTQTAVAVATLPIGGTGVSFAVEDLPAGNYTYTVSSSALLGSFATAVSLGATTTFLDDFTLATRGTAEGNLLANDTANTPFAAIRLETPGGLVEVGNSPVTLTGQHGTLTVSEAGGYVYTPSATLGYSAVDLVDTFTYQLVQPNGTFATATLAVTIDVPADGVASAASMTTELFSVEPDVVSLDALAVHAIAGPVAPVEHATAGLPAYDLFEGQGSVEDVLSHYLGDGGSAVDQPAAIATIDAPPPVVADPLDYLVLADEQARNGTVAGHVV